MLAKDWGISLCPVPKAADRAAGRMFPPVYLEVSGRVDLRVSLWMTARAPLSRRDHLQL